MKKPWQGRFLKDTAESVLRFTASLPFDRRLAEQDLKGSEAHVTMLADCGIITGEEAAAIKKGLTAIAAEIRENNFPFDLSFEDIHMNIEKRLLELAGPVGGKLHTARSRNDQAALDLHLYLMEEIRAINDALRGLQAVFLELARKCDSIVLPGYTHLQRAQPVLFSHHLLAYFWMLQRDRERLQGAYRRADLMPLGAGALAGTGFPIDREQVAQRLGFSRLYENSMDAVSDRDYIVEFLSFAAILMMHLSRLAEELILWSSAEFGFIELDDAYTTGSSMMPQKKNPDVAELARGKTGRVYGSLIALLTVLKGLPLTYNKDLQEDKEGLFDTVDTLKALLPLLGEMLRTMRVDQGRMAEALKDDYACATDLADYLVRQGLAFREAHRLVGAMIAYGRQEGLRLKELTVEQRRRFHPALSEEIAPILDPVRVVQARGSRGGTASGAVQDQLRLAEEALADDHCL
ncbi:MAG: argininosuccinate lyase [Bacillota bacterium]